MSEQAESTGGPELPPLRPPVPADGCGCGTCCPFCNVSINADDDTAYREVTSWVTGPKLQSPVLRAQTGRRAHETCIKHLVARQAPDQPEIEGPYEGD